MTTELETLLCVKHGPYTQKCGLCVEEDSKERDRREEVENSQRRLIAAHIPARFRGKVLESFEADTDAQQAVLCVAKNYAWDFPRHYAAGRCLVLMGTLGTGKTHLANAILQTLLNTEFLGWNPKYARPDFYTALYTTAAEVAGVIKDTWRAKGGSERAAIESFVRPQLLVLDEIGATAGTDFEREKLAELINMRYSGMRPTIAITNCDLNGLKSAISERAFDRLCENGGLRCAFDWESYRK